MSIHVTDRVWIGLRCDGVELLRVEAMCREVSRSNGLAMFETVGPVLFVDIPTDCADGLMTVHDGPHSGPFSSAPVYRPLLAGQNVSFDGPITFEVPLDVPKFTPPPAEPKRRRIRLGT